MAVRREVVSAYSILIHIFIQIPLSTSYDYLHENDGYAASGDGGIPIAPPPYPPINPLHDDIEVNPGAGPWSPICQDMETYTGQWWLNPCQGGGGPGAGPIPPIRPQRTTRRPRTTTRRPQRPRTTRTPRTTTTRTPRTTTTRTPRTTTTRTPRTTTKRTPRTTTKRTPRTTTKRTPRTTTTATPVITTSTKKPCLPSETIVRGGPIPCSGDIIFEDHFDSFHSNKWQIQHYIPSRAPNFPFLSYQNLPTDPTVSVEGGALHIAPKLQEKQPGYNNDTVYTGTLDLRNGCTSSGVQCWKKAWGADILPPVVSGKIISKDFAFMYGTVTVRAKLPQGDWIYPEILLEPFAHKYGNLHYASGVIDIASARGNKELKTRTIDYSNKVLFGGPIMDSRCHDTLLGMKVVNKGQWGDQYHKYSVRWTKDSITLLVDGKKWAYVQPSSKGLRGQFSRSCTQIDRNLLATGTKMAPFDDFFQVALGVGAGGIKKFPDRADTAGGRSKPWTNQSSKGLYKFWQDVKNWHSTWNQPQMLIDYVEVVAL